MKFTETGPKLRLKDIAVLESALEISLPADYKAFLLQQNGGRPEFDSVSINDFPESPTDVQSFFQYGGSVPSDEILASFRNVRQELLDPVYVPIACDSFGSLFCLKFEDRQNPYIVYREPIWKVKREYFVAASFAEFFSMLKPFDEGNCGAIGDAPRLN